MPRDSRVYLEDILGAIARIRRYTRGLSKDAFAADDKTVDAVVRNLEVIGEAVKRLSVDLRGRRPEIEWQKIAGLRLLRGRSPLSCGSKMPKPDPERQTNSIR